METLKQDARRFGVPFLNPCVNRSGVDCVSRKGTRCCWGCGFVRDVGEASARAIVEERDRGDPYAGTGDLVRRTGLKPRAVESLVMAGAFDSVSPNRRMALWDAGLGIRPSGDRTAGLSRFHPAPGPSLGRFHRLREDGRGIPGHGRLSPGAPDGVRAARPRPAGAARRRGGGYGRGRGGPGGRLAHSPAAPQGKGRHGVRHRGGRDRGRAGHPVAEGLSPEPERVAGPGAPGQGRGLPLGSDHQRGRFRR